MIGTNRLQILLALAALFASVNASAADAVMGWRGDGTGKYLKAHPPVTWSRTSAAMKGTRFGAEKPGSDDSGTAMPDGVIRDWLVAGPVAMTQKGDEQVGLADEAAIAPADGEPAGEGKWKKISSDSAYVDFTRLLGKPENENVAGYAFTNVFSPTGGKYRLNMTVVGHARLWINGKPPAQMGTRTIIDLAKGWNRLLLRVTPGEKDWYAVPVLRGQGQVEYSETGIAWRSALPGTHPAFYGGGMGAGGPVIVGDKIYLLSEPHDLICLNKSDGKPLWIRRASYFEAATDEEKKLPAYTEASAIAAKVDAINTAFVANKTTADQVEQKGRLETALRKQMKKLDATEYANQEIPDVGFSGFTPVFDGKFLYAWFGDGVSASFTLDGVLRWIRVDQHLAVEHGFSGSPTVVGGKFIVYMRDLTAFDCGSGKPVWQTPTVSAEGANPGDFCHGSIAVTKIGDVDVILLGNGMIVRVADGKILWKAEGENQAVPTPVVGDGGQIFHVSQGNSNLTVRQFPNALTDPLTLTPRMISIDLSMFPKHYLPWHLCSPLVHEGLAYMINNAGVLTVIDVAAGTIVYQKMLDLDVFQDHNEGAARGVGASPILAGGHIYILGSSGTTIVFEPGKIFRQLAKNKIENVAMPGHWSERQERFVANPVADGERIYIRGEESLYAVGAK